MSSPDDNGIVNTASAHPFAQTLARLTALLEEKGITLFARIEHSVEAEKVGMRMPPTTLLVFGSPRGGTPLMIASPEIALDLPLKILVREDESGRAWLTYNAPAFLEARHHLPAELTAPLAAVEALAAAAARSSG